MQTDHSKLIAPTLYSGINVPPREKGKVTYFVQHNRAISVVEFSMEGYKIRKVFWQKIKIPKQNFQILRIGVVGRCQKVQDFQSHFQS